MSGMQKSKNRIKATAIIMAVVIIVLIMRLAQLQLLQTVNDHDLVAEAKDQWYTEIIEFPNRGNIYDTNGDLLAQSAMSTSIGARPKKIEDPEYAANILSITLGMEYQALYELLSDVSKEYVWVKRQVDDDQALAIMELDIAGLEFNQEPKRYYPNGKLASQVIGFTKKYAENDGLQGQTGLEYIYDKYLKGYPGVRIIEGMSISDSTGTHSEYMESIDGMNLSITIDTSIQYFVEKAVDDAMDNYNANQVYCIVTEPKTGAILASYSTPGFDANNPPRNLPSDQFQQSIQNSVATNVLDPGSTFKIITAASGLDAGVVSESSTMYCPGYYMVDGERIGCWKTAGHGSQTFFETLQNSCNPMFMDIALKLGVSDFYDYIYKFGFGQKTGIEMLGESTGVLVNENYVTNGDLARIGFGQAISVTPLQLVMAVGAVINGGNLMEPYLVKEITQTRIDEVTGVPYEEIIDSYTPRVVRRVVSEETSAIMREGLESVVNEGSGIRAALPGYRIGGKTGTSQKYGDNGQILEGKHLSSFIGFAPADDPEFLVYLVVDEPEVEVDFGSTVAAPYVGEMMYDILKYLGIQPSYEGMGDSLNTVIVPNVIDKTREEAISYLESVGLQYKIDDDTEIIGEQFPMAGTRVAVNTEVLLYAVDQDDITNPNEQEIGGVIYVEVPNLIGKSIRECNQQIVSMGCKFVIQGSGIAISQNPEPGTLIKKGDEIQVIFQVPGE